MLPEEAVQELKAIFFDVTGVDISIDEARLEAESYLKLINRAIELNRSRSSSKKREVK